MTSTLYAICAAVGGLVLGALLLACLFFFGVGALAWVAGAWERVRGREP